MKFKLEKRKCWNGSILALLWVLEPYLVNCPRKRPYLHTMFFVRAFWIANTQRTVRNPPVLIAKLTGGALLIRMWLPKPKSWSLNLKTDSILMSFGDELQCIPPEISYTPDFHKYASLPRETEFMGFLWACQGLKHWEHFGSTAIHCGRRRGVSKPRQGVRSYSFALIA